MPSWFPVAGITNQRVLATGLPASGYVLKLYRAGTSTNIPIATDSTGGTQANYATANATGDWTVSSNVIIPHINEDYKLVIYPTQAAADADSGATLSVDNIALATINISLVTLGVTASAAELNIMDGVTATTAELNYTDGVTSNIQTQLNTKVAGTGASVDSELMLFSGTGGYTAKRATTTGLLKAASGVVGAVVSGTDIKTINGVTILGSGDMTTAAGALIYLSTVTSAGAATIDVETGFSSTYDDYVIIGTGLSTVGIESIVTRWKLGGSYITTSTYIDASGTATASSVVSLTNAGGSATTNGALVYEIFGVNSATTKFGRVRSQGVQGTPNLGGLSAAHFNSGTGTLTGIRFFGSGGSNIAGTFKLYGVTKA